jgi:hypothetical protein
MLAYLYPVFVTNLTSLKGKDELLTGLPVGTQQYNPLNADSEKVYQESSQRQVLSHKIFCQLMRIFPPNHTRFDVFDPFSPLQLVLRFDAFIFSGCPILRGFLRRVGV